MWMENIYSFRVIGGQMTKNRMSCNPTEAIQAIY